MNRLLPFFMLSGLLGWCGASFVACTSTPQEPKNILINTGLDNSFDKDLENALQGQPRPDENPFLKRKEREEKPGNVERPENDENEKLQKKLKELGNPGEHPRDLSDEEKVQKLALDDPERLSLSNHYLSQAENEHFASNHQSALRYLEFALELDPSNQSAIALRENIYALLGVGGSIYSSVLEEDAALSNEARFEVTNRINQAEEALQKGLYTEAIDKAQSVLDVLRWSGLRLSEANSFQIAKNIIDQAKELREEGRLRDASNLREEARRLKEAESLAQLERHRDEIRQLYDRARKLFDHKEYSEAVTLLNQIIRKEPFNEEVKELRGIAEKLAQGEREERIHQDFIKHWKEAMAKIRHSGTFPTKTLEWSSYEDWRRTEERALRLREESRLHLSKADVALRTALETTLVNLEFPQEIALQEILESLRNQGNINIVIINRDEVDEGDMIDFGEVSSIPLKSALNILARKSGFSWRAENGAVLIDEEEPESPGKGETRVFEVADILQNLRSFEAIEPRLSEDSATNIERWPEDIDENTSTLPEPEDLVDLLLDLIAPDTWGDDPWPDPIIRQKQLVVTNTLEVVTQVETLLSDLRNSQGLVVNVQARFITIRDDFLEDIGIDFQGVGGSPIGSTPPPVAAALDDINFGTNNLPVGAGTNNTSGFFFQDINNNNSVNEDIRARTEALFDQAIGGRRSGFGLTNSGGASFQLAFVDNPEINAILRAVKKKERATLLRSPAILIHNTQRSYFSLLNEINYIEDYDVETATNTSIANPSIGQIRDGIVLDVRPTVSADRRYITLELRPTLATLVRPIATITTTLGTGPPVSIQTPELRLQRVRTTVTIPDGGSFLVGGLRRMEETDLESGIPILSDIPLIGWLFTRKAKTFSQQDLIIIVQARLIHLEEEIELNGYNN